MKEISKLICLVLKRICALIAIDLLLCVSYLGLTEYFIKSRELTESVDVAAVFFAGYGENEGLNEGTYRAVLHAKQLYSLGLVKNIICLGGARLDNKPRGAELMCRFLEHSGIPKEVLIPDNSSWDTISNWREAHRIIKEKGWTSVVLISSPFHMVRALYAASETNVSLKLSPYRGESYWDPLMFYSRWHEIHHEFEAWTAMALLSSETYDRMIKEYRLGNQ